MVDWRKRQASSRALILLSQYPVLGQGLCQLWHNASLIRPWHQTDRQRQSNRVLLRHSISSENAAGVKGE